MTTDPIGASAPGLVDRVRNIILQPRSEWERIDAEPADVGRLYMGYVLPLAGLAALCATVGQLLFRWGAWGVYVRLSPVQAIVSGVFQFVMAFAGIYLIAIIINALAPTFGSTQNQGQAHKVAVYSWTPGLLAGVFSIHPTLSVLGLLGLYALVLLFMGLPRLMKTPEDKRIGYYATVIIASLVAGLVLSIVVGAVRGAAFGLGGGFGGYQIGQNAPAPGATVEGQLTLPGGGTVDLSQLGQAQGGSGAAVDPARLAAILPQALPGGFTQVSTSSGSAMGATNAEAVYRSGDAQLVVSVTHLGPMGAMAAMAGAVNVQESRQDADGYARTQTVDGRVYIEEVSRSGGTAKYAIIGRGVAITADGSGGVTIEQARAVVESLNVQRLEQEFGG